MRSLIRRGWLSNEHGAWVMTALPIAVGICTLKPQPIQFLLLAAWTAAYCSYHALTLYMAAAPQNLPTGDGDLGSNRCRMRGPGHHSSPASCRANPDPRNNLLRNCDIRGLEKASTLTPLTHCQRSGQFMHLSAVSVGCC